MKGCLDFLDFVYKRFGFTFKLNLSTRPDKFLGDVKVWDHAEKVSFLVSFFHLPKTFKRELNPKIDFSSFEHLGVVKQLYEAVSRAVPKNLMFCNESTRFDRRLSM